MIRIRPMKEIKGYITNEEGKLYINKGDGKSYINQTALAEICGVSQQTVSKKLKTTYNQSSEKPLEGSQAIENTYNLDVKTVDGLGTLMGEEIVADIISYYANKGKKEAIKWMSTMFRIGLRQATYNILGYELPRLENNPLKTFPKYERTICDWLEEWFEADFKLIEREFRLPSGCRADFLLNNRIVVEVKNVKNWKLAVGQALSYKVELMELGCKNIGIMLIFFGPCDIMEQRSIRNQIQKMGTSIKKVKFLTDLNLKDDRR